MNFDNVKTIFFDLDNFFQQFSHRLSIATKDRLPLGSVNVIDVRNIVFVRPLRSAILYKQMKGRGTRLCEDINKRYFTIFDYSGASMLEDAEFEKEWAAATAVAINAPVQRTDALRR